jgi:hypothetical protein
MLKGDTEETIVRCMACCERFQIGAHLTQRPLYGRKRGAKSKSLNGKGGFKAARQ